MSTMAFTDMYLAAVRWREARRRYQHLCQRVVNARRLGQQDNDGIAALAGATDERINAEEQLDQMIAALDAASRDIDHPEIELEPEDLRAVSDQP